MSSEPIIIQDNGSGMTEEELRHHYLFIASDRRSRGGERTAGKNRLIKGRKGIGKFAGLLTASVMSLQTRASWYYDYADRFTPRTSLPKCQ